jgi:hypothetical protein
MSKLPLIHHIPLERERGDKPMSDFKIGSSPQLPINEQPDTCSDAVDSKPALEPGTPLNTENNVASNLSQRLDPGIAEHVFKQPNLGGLGQGGPQQSNFEGGVRPASEWLLEQGKLSALLGAHARSAKRETTDTQSSGSGGAGAAPAGSGPGGGLPEGLGSGMKAEFDALLADAGIKEKIVDLPGINFDANFGNPSGPLPEIVSGIANAISNPSSIPSTIANAVSSLFNSPTNNAPALPNIDLSPPPAPSTPPSSQGTTYQGPSDAPVNDGSPPSEPGDYDTGTSGMSGMGVVGGDGGDGGDGGADGVGGGETLEEREV